MQEIYGNINSIETMGLVDGPGIRFVVFLQGCNLRCAYCHNPETWQKEKLCQKYTPKELIAKILRYKNYYGKTGGVTFSGGEPLLQPDFLLECLKLCKKNNIHTAIDTAGVGYGEYKEILKYTDLIILDIKAVDKEEYKKLTGQSIDYFNEFVRQVQQSGNKLWIRQVIVPTINDNEKNILALKDYVKKLKNVEKVELLPYRTIGVSKYKELKIPYRLENIEDMSDVEIKKWQALLEQ